MLEALGRLGNRCVVPPVEGAFYCLVRFAADIDTVVLAERLIREHGVAVVPGTAFGAEHGACVRVAYGALDRATVEEGMGRLVDGLSRLLPVTTDC